MTMDVDFEFQATKSINQNETFRVGIVGASKQAYLALNRIFIENQHRDLNYLAVPIKSETTVVSDDIDFVILCTNNPQIIALWTSGQVSGIAMGHPLIRLARNVPSGYQGYVITLPVNPEKLLELMDQYVGDEICHKAQENTVPTDTVDAAMSSALGLVSENVKNILLIDQSRVIKIFLEGLCDYGEFRVINSYSPDEAIRYANQQAFDLILLDLELPGTDGYETCKRLKQSALNENTPVVLLVYGSVTFDRVRAALSGCDRSLEKPVSQIELEDLLKIYFPEDGS